MGKYNQFYINVLKSKDTSLVEKLCCTIEFYKTSEVSQTLERFYKYNPELKNSFL